MSSPKTISWAERRDETHRREFERQLIAGRERDNRVAAAYHQRLLFAALKERAAA